MRAPIVVSDGLDPLDAVAPFDVLRAYGVAPGGVPTVEPACAGASSGARTDRLPAAL
ncbi:hypothetical protein [Microtetraspora niveoalba]|uniref:hypothetical protein n=1 Tax=Microtetraspora niveoalba TaxID=46175 RepID=UPI000AB0588F|nr:hypothetical protein [Microtetraspora niveoalba]